MQPVIGRRSLMAGLGASIALGGARTAAGTVVPASGQWSDLELIDAQERAFRLGETGRSLTMIQLWAHWCPLCLDELDALAAAAPAMHQHGIGLLLVSNPREWEADRHVAQSRGVGIRMARPSDHNGAGAIRRALLDSDGWYYVPRSLLYDHASRRVIWSHLGRLDWQQAPWRGEMPAAGA